jgi:ribosomal protein S4E
VGTPHPGTNQMRSNVGLFILTRRFLPKTVATRTRETRDELSNGWVGDEGRGYGAIERGKANQKIDQDQARATTSALLTLISTPIIYT